MKLVPIFLVCLALLSSIWAYRLVWGQPTNFNLFVERVIVKQALADPELLTYLGSIENGPLDFHSGKLTDISYSKNTKILREFQNSLATLHAYDRSRLTVQEQLTYDILEQYLKDIIHTQSFGFGSHLNAYEFLDPIPYPVNQLFGMQSALPSFMANVHRISSKKSAQNYISRLSQWGRKFDSLLEELKRREENGVIPPLFVLEKVAQEIGLFINTPPMQNILYTTLATKLEAVDLSMAEKETLQAQSVQQIETTVYPAYAKLLALLERQKSIATQDAGVWKLPHGDAYYLHCLRHHTTTDYSPEKIHALGLSEVDRIQEEMKQTLAQLGYSTEDVMKTLSSLNHDPKFLYPNSPEGREQVLADFREIFKEMKTKLPLLFSHFPKAELKIAAVPDFKAKTAPMAYYEPGDLKGERPGVFYINNSDMNNQSKLTMAALAWHEGIPGHHFQIALAQEIQKVPTIRKIALFNAYVEGWALYCEQLGWESGFTTDLHSNLGRLQMELMRAVRLVVDTGIHNKRWSREQAIQYMVENTGMNEEEVTSEIERYIVFPGQACSYKIGMIKILELREKMKERLGSAFDIRKFHEIVLENGAMPLTLLEKLIDHAISTQ